MRSKPGEERPRSSAPGAADGALVRTVARCRRDGRFLSALREVYRQVDLAVARRPARCLGGGACCKFDLMDHRLYLSTGELALLALRAPPRPGRCDLLRCPYQVGPRCMARARRPLGCRLFFCAPDLADWSARAYETFHRQVRRLHAVRALPYAYRELTAALGELTHPACPDAAPDPGELPMLFSVDRGGRGD